MWPRCLQKLEKEMLDNFSARTTLEKGKAGVLKLVQQLQTAIHEKQIQAGDLDNEIARIKVDTLNTAAHNKELKATLQAYDKELAERDKLGEKYEAEIRSRHDKIEKKQIYIMRLNKKFEAITANKGGRCTCASRLAFVCVLLMCCAVLCCAVSSLHQPNRGRVDRSVGVDHQPPVKGDYVGGAQQRRSANRMDQSANGAGDHRQRV
jgi:hypothetical protein